METKKILYVESRDGITTKVGGVLRTVAQRTNHQIVVIQHLGELQKLQDTNVELIIVGQLAGIPCNQMVAIMHTLKVEVPVAILRSEATAEIPVYQPSSSPFELDMISTRTKDLPRQLEMAVAFLLS